MATIEEAVKDKYGRAAREVREGARSSCCTPKTSCCSPRSKDPITAELYAADEVSAVPAEAVLASLGCGNPTALAELHQGEVVLDLGSGGGIDVLLSAQRVGASGKVYGLDMTDDMLELARENQRRAGVKNVEFLKGHIEEIPLPANSVDVIISNCVINLSADKGKVLREAFRVLKPGGRIAVSDIVTRRDVSPQIRRSIELWIGCLAGALQESEYRSLLQDAGFTGIGVEPTRVYTLQDARPYLLEAGIDPESAADVDGAFMSAFVRATKPAR